MSRPARGFRSETLSAGRAQIGCEDDAIVGETETPGVFEDIATVEAAA